MFEQTPVLTNSGESLLIRSLSGEKICFTRFKAGSGTATGSNPADLMDLRVPELAFPITSVERGNGNEYLTVKGKFDNEMLEGRDLYWRELGLFCAVERITTFTQQGQERTYTLTGNPYDVVSVRVGTDTLTKEQYDYNRNNGVLTLKQTPMVGKVVTVYHPDPNDVLYAYCYDAQNTGLILSAVSSTRLVQTVEMVITIQGASVDTIEVGEEIDAPELKNALNDHINDLNNPHQVTKDQVGLGLVPNVATDDQTPNHANIGADNGSIPQPASGEKISVSLAKTARVIKRFIEHVTSKNPHNITPEKIGVSKPEFGIYEGDGNGDVSEDYRFIDLGFTPSAVYIYGDPNKDKLDPYNFIQQAKPQFLLLNSEFGECYSIGVKKYQAYWVMIGQIVEGGIMVGNSPTTENLNLNKTGWFYKYIAWR